MGNCRPSRRVQKGDPLKVSGSPFVPLPRRARLRGLEPGRGGGVAAAAQLAAAADRAGEEGGPAVERCQVSKWARAKLGSARMVWKREETKWEICLWLPTRNKQKRVAFQGRPLWDHESGAFRTPGRHGERPAVRADQPAGPFVLFCFAVDEQKSAFPGACALLGACCDPGRQGPGEEQSGENSPRPAFNAPGGEGRVEAPAAAVPRVVLQLRRQGRLQHWRPNQPSPFHRKYPGRGQIQPNTRCRICIGLGFWRG